MSPHPAYEPERAFADALDRNDPLRDFRSEFHIPRAANGRPVIYLCGNSLGLQPVGSRPLIQSILDSWATQGVDGHFHGPDPWLSYPDHVTGPTARIVGALPQEVTVMNALTVNLHLMMVTFYRPTPERHRILVEASTFPSDLYAFASQARFHGYDPGQAVVQIRPREGEYTVRTEDIEAMLERDGRSIALVVLGGVNYYTGQAFRIGSIAAAARRQGCIVGLDLAHAAGNIPLSLHDWNVDFAVWCSYKYLNAGPGGPAGCFVHERHHGAADIPRFSGWWGESVAKRFAMTPDFVADPGAAGWQISNPPLLMLAAYRAAVEQFERATMPRLRAKSIRLTGYLEYLLRRSADRRFTILTPVDPEERGAQLSIFMHDGGRRVFEGLSAAGIVCDWREPNVIRVAPVPLYSTYEEVHSFASSFLALLGE